MCVSVCTINSAQIWMNSVNTCPLCMKAEVFSFLAAVVKKKSCIRVSTSVRVGASRYLKQEQV